MRLILVRHGETEDNAANIVQGQTHGCLSANGRSQAESAALRLKETPVDAIYTSDLERVRDTATAIAAQLPNLPRTEDTRLREQDFGVFEGRPIIELLKTMRGENADFSTFVPLNGETRADFQARIISFLNEMRNRHAGETVLVVTHYGVINILLGWLLKHEAPLSTDWEIANGSVTILDVDEDGRGEPHVLNDIAHLLETRPKTPSAALSSASARLRNRTYAPSPRRSSALHLRLWAAFSNFDRPLGFSAGLLGSAGHRLKRVAFADQEGLRLGEHLQ